MTPISIWLDTLTTNKKEGGSNYHGRLMIYTCIGTWTLAFARYFIQVFHGSELWHRWMARANRSGDFYLKRFSFTIFCAFFIYAQIYIFSMPTIKKAAFSVCNQLNTVLTQQFPYSSSHYPYPTTYADIANVGDIYAFIRGPVMAHTIYTSDGASYNRAKYYQGTKGSYGMMASKNTWAFTGDLRIRQASALLTPTPTTL